MIRKYLLKPITLIFLSCSLGNSKLIKLSDSDFNSFPNRFEVLQTVFEYYYKIGFANKNLNRLNDSQKTLCFYFICDGLISNSGFYSILLETNGVYNIEFSKALERVRNNQDKIIFDEIISIYIKYENWFCKQINPPELYDSTTEFNEKLHNRIKELEKKWFANSKVREKLFNEYFEKNKQLLVEYK
jgi:hypothetical protein